MKGLCKIICIFSVLLLDKTEEGAYNMIFFDSV